MNDKIRKELNDMLIKVAKEKELAYILYENLWERIKDSYYSSIAYNYNMEYGIKYEMNLEEEVRKINNDNIADDAMVMNILCKMVSEDGFKFERCYGGHCMRFIISVEQINRLINQLDESKSSTAEK